MRVIIHEGVAVDIATIPNIYAGASRMQLSASMPSGSKDRAA